MRAPWACVLLAACAEAPPAALGPVPPMDDPLPPRPRMRAPPEETGARSGARLRQIFLQFEDGGRTLADVSVGGETYFDLAFGRCTPREWSGGKTYCTPDASPIGYEAGCTSEIARATGGNVIESSVLDRRPDPSEARRFQPIRYTAGGLDIPDPLHRFDATLETECRMTQLLSGEVSCVPLHSIQRFYTDEACSNEILLTTLMFEGTCGVVRRSPRFVTVPPTNGLPAEVRGVRARYDGPLYSQWGTACRAEQASSGVRHEVGPPLAAFFPRATLAVDR